jgi:chemotaxis protein CheC
MEGETFELSAGAKRLLNDVWSTTSHRSIQALSKTLNKNVTLKSTQTRVGTLKEIPKLLNPDQLAIAVVTVRIKGIINGVIFVFAEQKDMIAFADILLRKKIGTSKNLDETNISVIKELGNLLSGYYAEDFIKLIEASISLQKPDFGFNEYRAIEKTGLGKVYAQEINVLMFESEFTLEVEGFKARVLVVFNEKSSANIYYEVLKKI